MKAEANEGRGQPDTVKDAGGRFNALRGGAIMPKNVDSGGDLLLQHRVRGAMGETTKTQGSIDPADAGA